MLPVASDPLSGLMMTYNPCPPDGDLRRHVALWKCCSVVVSVSATVVLGMGECFIAAEA